MRNLSRDFEPAVFNPRGCPFRSRRFFGKREFKMVSYWRQAGLSYLSFSSICARLVRRCLKPDLRVEALKREESLMKTVKWEGGKQVGEAKSIAQ